MGPRSGPEPRAACRGVREVGSAHLLEEYRTRYLSEIETRRTRIADLAARVRQGETITLLCSSACVDETRCHRSLLRELIDSAVAR